MSGSRDAGVPDSVLIGRWKEGGSEAEAAAAELVRRHAGALARYLSASGAGDDVEDLVQEAFFRAFRRIETFRGGSSFRTWVVSIAANVMKDAWRRSGRRPELALEDSEIPDGGQDPHQQVVGWDAERRLEEAVRRLPEMQREVFLLRAQQGFEYQEIAEVLGTSVGAARVHYHHAVKRLKSSVVGRES